MKTPQIDYPGWWTYALVGTDEEDLRRVIGEIAKGANHRVKFSKWSAAKRYASLHVEIQVASQEERDRFFESFKTHPRVKYVI